MQPTQRNILIIAAVIVAILAGVMYQKTHIAPVTQQTATTTDATELANIDFSKISTTTKIGEYTITPLPTGTPAPTAPDYTKPAVYSATVSAEVRTALEAQFVDVRANLSKNKNDLNEWLHLGVLYKTAGDYQAAVAPWTYVAKLPTNVSYIAYGNLGDLYLNFLKDYPKAEANYKAAVSIKPEVIEYYRGLFTLYRNFYKTNTSAAADIVAQGLRANPNNPDLLQMQSELK